MGIDLTTKDAVMPIPRTFWGWAALAAAVGIALGVWLAGRLDRGPRPEAVLVALERILGVYVLGAYVLVAIRRTRSLGLLLSMGLFIFVFGLLGGIGTYWTFPALRAVR